MNTLVEISDDGEYWIKRYFSHFTNSISTNNFKVFESGCTSFNSRYVADAEHCRLVEQKDFTYWPGGECPLPDGVLVDIVFRSREVHEREKAIVYSWRHQRDTDDIIAYRIIGLANGWEY